MSKNILFLNGKIDLEFCQKYIQTNYPKCKIYCTDGAYLKIKSSKFIFSNLQRVIGDFDSLNYVENDLFYFDKNQNNTDFDKALEYLSVRGVSELVIFGASGGEMDHFLSNMSIAKAMKNIFKMTFVDEYSSYFFIAKNYQTQDVKDKMFSVMPFPFATKVYYKGLEYNLSGQSLELGVNTGARNFARENVVEITYEQGDVLLFISHKNYK